MRRWLYKSKSYLHSSKVGCFLEYAKLIIPKVSFDSTLLNKEYLKCSRYLTTRQRVELNSWLEQQPYYPDIRVLRL